MRDLTADVRYAARALLARRSFTIAAILTLGIGIGMTTTIFSVLDGVVLRPLPFRNADRLVTLCERYPGAVADWCSVSPPNVVDIAERARSIEAIGIGRSWPFTLSSGDGADIVDGGLASPGMFEALGLRVELGRLIEPGDMLGRPSAVAVISHAAWQRRFGGARDILGRTLTLDGDPVTIVGVLEPDAHVPIIGDVDIWRPLHIDPRSEQHRDWRGFIAFGRLRNGVSLESARGEVATIARALEAAHFSSTVGWDVTPRTLHDLVVGNVRGPLLLLFGAVLLVLLVVCANVANLVLARGTSRGREMAIRAAVGASRPRIVRALLTESVLLAVSGAAVGLALSEWATDALKALAPPGIPRIEQVETNATVAAFAVGLAIVTAIVFGLLPALRISRVDLSQSLRDGARGGARQRGGLGRLLVIAELAIALPLVTGAVLLARSFVAQIEWRPGFDREHLLTFSLFLPSTAYASRSQIGATWGTLEREIVAIPGVIAVGTASAGPLFGGRETWEMQVEGRPATDKLSIRWYDISPGFFDALGVPLIRGRALGTDDVFGAPTAGLVNESLANRAWPGESPIGKRVMFSAGEAADTFTVKGVVRDVPPVRAGSPVEAELYWSNRQAPRPFTYFVVRTTVPPASIIAAVRARIKAVDPSLTPRSFATMADLVARSVQAPRFHMTLLLVFAVVALALAGIGTYGLLAYYVEQSQREIGIRLALGAQRDQVMLSVLTNGLTLAVVGLAVGIGASVLLARTLAGLLWGVSPYDPWSIGASAIVVVIVATAACLMPAMRASRVDPIVTLAAE